MKEFNKFQSCNPGCYFNMATQVGGRRQTLPQLKKSTKTCNTRWQGLLKPLKLMAVIYLYHYHLELGLMSPLGPAVSSFVIALAVDGGLIPTNSTSITSVSFC